MTHKPNVGEVVDRPLAEDISHSRSNLAKDIVSTLTLNALFYQLLHPCSDGTELLRGSSWVETRNSKLGYAIVSRTVHTPDYLHPVIDASFWTIDREHAEVAGKPAFFTPVSPDLSEKESIIQLADQFDTRELNLISHMIDKSIGTGGAFDELDRDVRIAITDQEEIITWLATHYPSPAVDPYEGFDLVPIHETPE